MSAAAAVPISSQKDHSPPPTPPASPSWGSSWWRRTRSSKPFICTTVNLAAFTDSYIYNLIIPVLPFALREEFRVSDEYVQCWIGMILAAYGVGLGIGAPVAATLAANHRREGEHRTNRRGGPCVLGAIIAVLALLLFAFGGSVATLVIARLLQGVAAGFVDSVGTAILSDAVDPDSAEMSFRFMSMMVAVGMVVGPAWGGAVYYAHGYQAVFVSAYILIFLDLVFRILMVEPLPNTQDYKGSLESEVSQAQGQAYDRAVHDQGYGTFKQDDVSRMIQDEESATTVSAEAEWLMPSKSRPNRPAPIITVTNTVTATTASPSPSPLSATSPAEQNPLSGYITLLRFPRFLAALLGSFLVAFILRAMEATLPLYLARLFHCAVNRVGLIFPLVTLAMLTTPFVGVLADKIGAKTVLTTGCGLLAPSWILLRLVDQGNRAGFIPLVIFLVFIGFGIAFVHTAASSEARSAVDESRRRRPEIWRMSNASAAAAAAGYTLTNAASAVGSVTGPVVGGVLVDRFGWNTFTLVLGIVCGVCCVLPPFLSVCTSVRNQGTSATFDNGP